MIKLPSDAHRVYYGMRVLRKFVFHRPTPLIAEAGRTPKIFTFYPRLYYVSGRQYGRILPMTERTDTKLTHPRPTEPRPKARTYGAAAGGFGALTSVWKEAWRHTVFMGGKRAIQTESNTGLIVPVAHARSRTGRADLEFLKMVPRRRYGTIPGKRFRQPS